MRLAKCRLCNPLPTETVPYLDVLFSPFLTSLLAFHDRILHSFIRFFTTSQLALGSSVCFGEIMERNKQNDLMYSVLKLELGTKKKKEKQKRLKKVHVYQQGASRKAKKCKKLRQKSCTSDRNGISAFPIDSNFGEVLVRWTHICIQGDSRKDAKKSR